MNSKVVSIRPNPKPIAHFVHLGHGTHRVLQNLFASGALPVTRVVVDAAHAHEQIELLASLKREGIQLILDPKSMELGTPGGATASRRKLPWASPKDSFWTADALGKPSAIGDVCKSIAEFAVSKGVDVVHAPTHLHHQQIDEWLARDVRACELLRSALDAAGGQSISIDYPLILSFSLLQSETVRAQLIASLRGLPFENLWLRADGFGIHASAARTKNLVAAASELNSMGRAIVLDNSGGFSSLVAASFGVVGGIAHGIANQSEQFSSYALRKPSKKPGGGSAKWVYLSQIDHYVKANHLDGILALRGTKSHLVCNDSSCCPHGTSSMKNQEKRHALRQRVRQISELSRIPENQRPDHLLRLELRPAGQACRHVERLASVEGNPGFLKVIKKQSRHLDDLAQLVEKLSPRRNDFARSREPTRNSSAVMPLASGY